MPRHLQREIEQLKKNILALSALVEETVQKAVEAVEQSDEALAAQVMEIDPEIDRREVELEEECLKILALHQPVARDLRFIVAVLKINNDLERIGDLAVNISERAYYLATHERVEIPADIFEMAGIVKTMLRNSLDALVKSSTKLAHQVCSLDEQVDDIHRGMYGKIHEFMEKSPAQLDHYTQIMSVSRYLERIADLATNIAEDVIYMYAGEIVRHSVERFRTDDE